MKSIILVHSYHHNNTKKVADTMGVVLNAKVKQVVGLDPECVNGYGLIGLGAGIDSAKHYKELLDFAKSMPENQSGAKCFIFSTSAIQGDEKVYKDHTALRDVLLAKGYTVTSEFSCKGYNTNSILKFFGGMNKDHPTKDDLNRASAFAKELAYA